MKPWLIKWCWEGDHAARENSIETVLSALTSAEDVRTYVERRYVEENASLDEKLAYARDKEPQEPPYRAQIERRKVHCGHNPFLTARGGWSPGRGGRRQQRGLEVGRTDRGGSPKHPLVGDASS